MKNNCIKIISICLLLTLIAGCAPSYIKKNHFTPVEQLSHQIDMQIATPELETAFIGILVQSIDTGEILYQHNAKKVMMPASNEKIPTSAAALIKFGPDYKYETKVYANGQIVDGVLKGDLIIVGSGDPTIGYRFCEKLDTCKIFRSWADALQKKGISHIEGNLIGVDDIFDDELLGYGWDVSDLSYYYAAQINGLILNENYARITIAADSNINIKTFPDYGYLDVSSNVQVTDDKKEQTNILVHRTLGTNNVNIKGKLKVGKSYVESVTVHNPTLYFLSGLRHELTELGVIINGKEIDSDDLPDSLQISKKQLIYTHLSPPFSKIIKVLMKESQNLYAESFVKLLGARFGKKGSFKEGAKIIKSTLVKFGLDKNSYKYRDGSGLCRYNYISPYHIVKILKGMYLHPYGEIYRNSLPVAGVDGTIDYRMKGTCAAGKVIAKTGTISNVRCLSGYAITKDDEVLVFSIMANNFLCSVHTIMDIQDRICMLLTSFSRK